MSDRDKIDVLMMALEQYPGMPYSEARLEQLIVGCFKSQHIKADEFHNYCQRFRRLTKRNVRCAA